MKRAATVGFAVLLIVSISIQDVAAVSVYRRSIKDINDLNRDLQATGWRILKNEKASPPRGVDIHKRDESKLKTIPSTASTLLIPDQQDLEHPTKAQQRKETEVVDSANNNLFDGVSLFVGDGCPAGYDRAFDGTCQPIIE
ncbi:uncharacterized protein LOC114243550 [Bombyx mandarina]|uniref:Uncharacterized protein LOC114243550 n=1 Tax=Bombyx mandarina TaxID=7092 RepID=A0A6J2JPD6_BOMMA|nr:uncharacterized protein LOC114243550 [Bombyx mandarina]